MFEKPFIIAEIGSNWAKSDCKQDNFFNALYQIEQAKECGADAVKFQLFTHEELYGYSSDCMAKYELPRNWLAKLRSKCDKEKIEFICSAFSFDAYLLVNNYVNIHKVAAPESNWKELLEYLHKFQKPVIVSKQVVADQDRYVNSFHENFYTIETVSRYPANPRDYCMPGQFDGISDHTKSMYLIEHALYNLHKIFEVHTDLSDDTKIKTPDSCVSLNKLDFIEYVDRIRNPNKYIKKPDYSRKKTQYGYYRSKYD